MSFGEEHENTLSTRTSRATALFEVGLIDESEAELRQVLLERTRILGVDHPKTLSVRCSLANLLRYTTLADEVTLQVRALLTDCLRVLGPHHPQTLSTQWDLIECLIDEDENEEAPEQADVLLEDVIQVLAEDHFLALQVRRTRAIGLWRAGRLHASVGRYEALYEDACKVMGGDYPRNSDGDSGFRKKNRSHIHVAPMAFKTAARGSP